LSLITWPIVLLLVSTSGSSAVTSTVYEACPMLSCTFFVTVVATSSFSPLNTVV
jgi:hypothetical protein